MRVLITGSQGFVGRAFQRHFYTNTGDTIRSLDIKHGEDCREYFRQSDAQWDLVIHCAAVVGGRTMIEQQPLHLAVEDLSIDAEMFKWAIRTRPGRIVYFSSSAVYPIVYQQSYGRALHERDVVMDSGTVSWTFLSPDQTYGWVKMTGERLAVEANLMGIKTHVFRPFSGYGETQDDNYPFPSIVKRCLDLTKPVTIWSNTVRDFVHIDDVVGAVLAAINNDIRGPVNICTGIGTSFKELAALAGRLDVLVEPGKPQGVLCRVGDPTYLNTFYTPKVSIHEGIRRALAHFKQL